MEVKDVAKVDEGRVYGTNYHRGNPKVETHKQRTLDDFAWRCKKSMTKRDIKKAKQLALNDKNPNRPTNNNYVDTKELERKRLEGKGLLPKVDTTNLFSVIENKLWIETCRRFDSQHIETDNITVGKEVEYDIKVGFLNMNSLAADCKIEYILWYYECLQLDFLFLSDIRLNKLQMDLFKKRAKSRLGAGTEIFSTLSKKHSRKNATIVGNLSLLDQHGHCLW